MDIEVEFAFEVVGAEFTKTVAGMLVSAFVLLKGILTVLHPMLQLAKAQSCIIL